MLLTMTYYFVVFGLVFFLHSHTHTDIYMVAYIIEPLACLDLRLDTTFKQEYSDATHATTLALFSSMKAQVSNLSMSLNSFWAIQFICKLTTLSTCWNKNSYQSIYVIYSHKVNKIQSNIKKTYMFSYYIIYFLIWHKSNILCLFDCLR